MEDVLVWTQTFNVPAENTNAKESIQNDQENNTEVTNMNIQEDRPETQPTKTSHYQLKQSTDSKWR